MKQKQMIKKLTFNKETVSNLELDKALGGKAFTDYSECGTGPATIMPCMCGGGETLTFC